MQRGSRRNRLLDRWLGIPLLNILAAVHRKRSRPLHPRVIGVMCSPALGDTLLFSAVLLDLRAHFPGAHIIHFCMKENAASAEILPGADERVLLSLTNVPAAIRVLRARPIDLFLDFTAWQRITALLTLLSRSRFTVGFRSPGQVRSRGYDLGVLHRNDQHELENFRDLLRALGIPAGSPPSVTLPPLTQPLFPQEADLTLFHLWAAGDRSHLREWPEDRWLELAHRLGTGDELFVVTGAPADLSRMRPFVARLQAGSLRAVAFSSPDGLVSLAHLLRRANLLVSVNTGTMHLAAILGTPTLALNGPTADHRWGPCGTRARSVAPPDGSGGFLHLGFEYDGHPQDTMRRISVDQVTTAAKQLLAEVPRHEPEALEPAVISLGHTR